MYESLFAFSYILLKIYKVLYLLSVPHMIDSNCTFGLEMYCLSLELFRDYYVRS